MNSDVFLKLTPDGGEYQLKDGKITLDGGLYTQVLLALFGANKTYSHNDDEGDDPHNQRDFWGNFLLSDNADQKFNGETETVLQETTIDDEGLEALDRQIIEDLLFLKKSSKIDVTITQLTYGIIEIVIILTKNKIIPDSKLAIIWDNTIKNTKLYANTDLN